MSRWLVVRVKASQFDRWFSKCTERGIEVYSPTIAVYVRHSRVRRPRLVRRPAYPGYAFVKANGDDGVLSAMSSLSCFGYLGPLMSFGKVAVLSELEIDRLRKLEQDMESELTMNIKRKQMIPPGSKVIVACGLFANMEGTAVRIVGHFAVVQFDTMQHPLKINTCLLKLKERY